MHFNEAGVFGETAPPAHAPSKKIVGAMAWPEASINPTTKAVTHSALQ